VANVVVPAGLWIFPLTYSLGVVLTEVYGFAASRRVIWMGLFCNVCMAGACQLAIHLPATEQWRYDEAYTQILSLSSQLMLASVVAYFSGELTNSYVVAALKKRMQGKFFWIRALCGNWLGEGVDTILLLTLAFWGHVPKEEFFGMLVFYYLFKVCYAAAIMPLLHYTVRYLQQPD